MYQIIRLALTFVEREWEVENFFEIFHIFLTGEKFDALASR